MVIIITGAIGIGKTTVCQKCICMARSQGYSRGGIITYKAPDESVIIEDIETGDRETFASLTEMYEGPRTLKYFFNPLGIQFGTQAIDRGSSADILFVDEVGYLELRGEGFSKVMELISAGKVKRSVLVIRNELLPLFSSRLGSEPLIFEVTGSNRSELPREIWLFLSKSSAIYKNTDISHTPSGRKIETPIWY